MKKDNECGVISLEACIVVPIFMMLIMFIYGFMLMFTGDFLVSHALYQSAESLSYDAYANDKLASAGMGDISGIDSLLTNVINLFTETSDDGGFVNATQWYKGGDSDVEQAVKERFIAYFSGGDEAKMKDMLHVCGIDEDSLDFSESSIEGNDLIIKIKYNQSFLFDINGLASFDYTKKARVRLFTH